MQSKDLDVGKVYFQCSYLCLTRPVPEIESWVYIGANLYKEDANELLNFHYFQDPESYYSKEVKEGLTDEQRIEYEPPGERVQIRVSENDLEGLVYDLSELRDFVNALASNSYSECIFNEES